jgi:hypothetical protein
MPGSTPHEPDGVPDDSEPVVREVSRQIAQTLAEAANAYPWVLPLLDGHRLDPTSVKGEDFLRGLAALFVALSDCVILLAAAVDRQDRPPT